ncbi:TetR/AcrR family transcriptional regulator [Nocardia mexicana]|uniref:TetR family transcriptional regulator n=1 Tax=Nocardia mexicana TaxID=279262 RepID=A0A370GL16_9NOCA|nr:TetR/AcrR family transcriptional regulator [Nocardia mexicana]RDI43936.1 TetR family transcriptional regulator [Nocardia mexicana]
MQEKRTSGEPTGGGHRAPRADARRNRERVLIAAREAFAAEGISVPLDEIARRAGVGPGTVYRHFPTKEALFQAAITDNVERMIEYARTLTTADDPGAAFFELLDRMVAEGGVKRDLAEALGGGHTVESSGPTKELVIEIDALLHRAQDRGAVRADIDTEDLMRILKGAFLAAHATGADEDQRARTFAVVFDGLRAR